MKRPDPSEFNGYYSLYVNAVPDGDILQILEAEGRAAVAEYGAIDPDRVGYRYAPDKWTIGEVLGHVVDTERVFAYRGLCIARGEQADLPAMDQNVYAAGSNAADRSLKSLVDELAAVRAASLALFANLDPSTATRAGSASGFPVTVRALAWILAGHEIHHRKVIRERYLDG